MKGALLMLLAVAGCSRTQQQPPGAKTEATPPYDRVDPATAGAIRGVVRYKGRIPPANRISMDAEEACQKLHPKSVSGATVVTGKGGLLANALVYIKSGLEGKTFEPPNQAVVLDQRGCLFVPRVLALQTGQTLTVKNSDPVSHNVHPRPASNREWNQQQPPGAPDLQRRFARPEIIIPVKCNIHSWMRSHIAVLDHPYFAVTDASGKFDWPTVPPGKYTVAVWHETLGERTEQVEVTRKSEQRMAVVFDTLRGSDSAERGPPQ